MCSVHLVFYISMLEPTTSNVFSKRTQLAPTLVIIDREPKYEISWIVDSKIDHWWVWKLLYKVILLGYKDIKDESKCISISKLTHTTDLISDFHITYSAKLSGAVHTRVEVYKMDLELCKLVKQPWLQLICCAILCYLSAAWLQLQMIRRSPRWKWVLISVLLLNTRDWVQ